MRYCSECKKEKTESFCSICNKNTGNNYEMKASAGVFNVLLPLLKMIHRRPGVKKFLRRVQAGFQSSGDISKHPDGVNISRVVDREYNKYEETITDKRTGNIVKNVQIPLDQHISNSQKRDS